MVTLNLRDLRCLFPRKEGAEMRWANLVNLSIISMLLCAQAQAAATRTVDADTLRSSDASKSYPLPSVAGTVTGSGNFVNEAPSGTINSSNTAFTLANTPINATTLHLFLDGVYLIPTTNYTISGSSITMITVPATGQSLRATYVK